MGTLIPEKGFEYVIRACRLLVDRGVAFECLIVGDGPDRAKLEELTGLLGLEQHVTLSPYRPQEELRCLFQQAAVFTLPCIFPLNGNVDVIPLVLQEAMAMARPVVGTPVSGIPELITDGVTAGSLLRRITKPSPSPHAHLVDPGSPHGSAATLG